MQKKYSVRKSKPIIDEIDTFLAKHYDFTNKELDFINEAIGNIDLLKLPKTAFLCSRKVPASVVLKCYD